jgi:hypothetical protein
VSDALCVKHPYDPALWDFEVHGETFRQQKQRQRIARDICLRCSIRQACAASAVPGREEGTWGGRHLRGLKMQGEQRRVVA